MKTKLALGAVVAAIAVFSQTAFAQASAPVSREERKAETAAANKAGKLTPAGEGDLKSTPPKTSDKTREARKAQAQADAKSGKLTPAGEGADPKKDKAEAAKPSQTTREARKAQTEADRKAGKLTPAGEGAAKQ
jgi:hypothetical protein